MNTPYSRSDELEMNSCVNLSCTIMIRRIKAHLRRPRDEWVAATIQSPRPANPKIDRTEPAVPRRKIGWQRNESRTAWLRSNSPWILATVALLVTCGQGGAAMAAEGSRYSESYPTVVSKKGLQVELVDDVLELGIQHATFNVDLCRIVDPDANPTNPSWEYGGHATSFSETI